MFPALRVLVMDMICVLQGALLPMHHKVKGRREYSLSMYCRSVAIALWTRMRSCVPYVCLRQSRYKGPDRVLFLRRKIWWRSDIILSFCRQR